MSRWWVCSGLALAACAPETSNPGIQLGEETITSPDDPCDVRREVVAFDEPALDGRSAEDLLAALPTPVTVAPAWFDVVARELTIEVTPTGGDVTLVTITGADAACATDPFLELELDAHLATADGLVDGGFGTDGRLAPGWALALDVELDSDGLGGTLDAEEVLAEAGHTELATSSLDVLVRLDPESSTSSGVITAIGRTASNGGTSTTSTGGPLVEAEIALW
ncbi:MAG: hypothetical protein H6735_19615 [Alphaproteobacteria bacterium]|nr:hypothetical protein [Alphaproteobacteria bacterium]